MNLIFKRKLRSQRGAMFGLDARIALAIFAGLSVIAGMAVFGTIRQTDVAALVSEFDNISKGYINYSFDTGINIPTGATTGQGFTGLFEATVAGPPVQPLGWDGPYITRSTAKHPKFGTYDIVDGSIDVAWAAPDTTGNIPGAWLSLTGVPCELIKDLDREIDGDTALTNDSGNLRYAATCNDGTSETLYFLLSRKMG